MKKITFTYWITTAIIALMMLFSAYSYLTSQQAKDGFVHLGFPNFFRIELAIAKLIGAILLLIPVCTRIKEWVYAGFAIVFISALVAHIASGDAAFNALMPVIFLGLLITSYLTYHKMKGNKCCEKKA